MCWLSGEQEPDIHMPELRASDMQPKKKKNIHRYRYKNGSGG